MSANRCAMFEEESKLGRDGHAPPPSPNGQHGETGPVGAAPQPQPKVGRDANGRFARGNAGGPGNPFGRQVAALRKLALEVVPPDKIRAIFAKLTDLALEGNVPAAKVVLAYTVGKPAAAPDPDRVDVDEWQHFKETAPMMKELGQVFTPEPIVPLTCARAARHAKTASQSELLVRLMTAPDGGRAEMDAMLKAKAAAEAGALDPEDDEPAEGEAAPPPSRNGVDGEAHGNEPSQSQPDRTVRSAESPALPVNGKPQPAVGATYSPHEVEEARKALQAILNHANSSEPEK